MPELQQITVTANEPVPPFPKDAATAATAGNVAPPAASIDGPANPASDDQLGDSYYPETTFDDRYEVHPGVAVQPLAGPALADGTTCEAVRLTAPYMTRVLDFTVERLNAKPKVPDWNNPDPNLVLTYATVTPAVPLMGPNGLRVYRVSGRYVWRLLAPLDPNGPWPVGGNPADTTAAAQNTFDPGQRDATLLG